MKWLISAIYPFLLVAPFVWRQNELIQQVKAQEVIHRTEMCNWKTDLAALEDSVRVYKDSLDALWELHPYLNEESLKKMYSFTDEYEFCPGTRFLLSANDRVKPNIDKELYKALSTYTGPPATITSMYRPHSKGSCHSIGRAVDIRWNENGKLMAEWLVSEDGVKWQQDNNLVIHFENIPDKRYRKDVFQYYYMWNPNATGPHIHIEVNERRYDGELLASVGSRVNS